MIEPMNDDELAHVRGGQTLDELLLQDLARDQVETTPADFAKAIAVLVFAVCAVAFGFWVMAQ